MPDELLFLSPEGKEVNLIPTERRLIKGVSSPTRELTIKNLSGSNAFVGRFIIKPVPGGRSTQDIEVSEKEGPWSKGLDVSIAPGASLPVRFRISPEATSPGGAGQAAIAARGNWSPVAPT